MKVWSDHMLGGCTTAFSFRVEKEQVTSEENMSKQNTRKIKLGFQLTLKNKLSIS